MAVIGIGRTALLTKTILIEDFGRIFIILNLLTVLSSFLGVRVDDVLYRFFPQFEKENNEEALRGLLYLSLGLSLAVGLLIVIVMMIFAPWISVKFYNDAALSLSFRIYAVAMLVYTFEGFNTAILRLHNRFSYLVLPRVVGAGLTFLIAFIYLALINGNYKIEWIIVAFSMGIIVQSLVPLVFSLRIVAEKLSWGKKGNPFIALKPYKRLMVSNLFHTNLIGYLKLASDSGGLFLLGIFSTPTQVAYFGIATQLTAPLKLIKNNIQNAVTPEIIMLWSRKRINQLYALIKGLVRLTVIWGGAGTLLLIIFVKPLLLIVTTIDYVGAMTTVYLLIVATYLNFISTSFYPLTVAMDKMPRRNMVVCVRVLYLGGAVLIGLNSVMLGAVHLFGVITVRLFSDMPLFLRLRKVSKKTSL